MPSNQEQIVVIKSQTLARIAEITENPKPTYKIDNQLVAWGDYLSQLRGTVEWCNSQLAAETPVEVQSRGIT
jgi:hypothetical protein